MTLPDSLNEGDAEHVTPATNEMGTIVAEQIQASFLPLLSASFYPLPGPTFLLFKVGQLWREPGILPGEVAVSCPGDPPLWLLWALIQASAVFRAQRQVLLGIFWILCCPPWEDQKLKWFLQWGMLRENESYSSQDWTCVDGTRVDVRGKLTLQRRPLSVVRFWPADGALESMDVNFYIHLYFF